MATGTSVSSHPTRPVRDRLRRPFSIETLVLALLVLIIVVRHGLGHGTELWDARWTLLAWVSGLTFLALLEVPTVTGELLVPDVPLLLAIALIFPPPVGAAVAFVGSASLAEFRNIDQFALSLNNRATTALGVAAASLVARALLVGPSVGWILAATCAGWLTWTLSNYLAAAASIAIRRDVGFLQALGLLRPGSLVDYAVINAAWCLLAALIVFLYASFQLWALLLLLVIALPLRQALLRSESAVMATREVDRQRQVISALSQRIAAERRDERLRVASELHDEVIPYLFEVSLLCQVIKRTAEITPNQREILSNLDELAGAANRASAEMRALIQGLRESPVGARGLTSAIGQLLRDLRVQSEAVLKADIPETLEGLPTDLHLAIYQVVREALTNAARHSKAKNVTVSMEVGEELISVEIADDGIGFDPWTSRSGHFGILIMQDRVASVGGEIYVDSVLGSGSTVRAHFPRITGV